MRPIIDAAASVHTLVQDFQLISCSEKNELTMLKISSPVLSPKVSASTATPGIISSSARLNGFLAFAKSKDTAYDASIAFADALVAFFSRHDVNS